MDAIRRFEENYSRGGHQSLLKDANKYADKLGLTLQLIYPKPSCSGMECNEIPTGQISTMIKEYSQQQLRNMEKEKWQVKLPNFTNDCYRPG